MGHQLYKTGDKDAPDCIKDRNGEVVLGLCRVCNQAEVELEPECPGDWHKPMIETLRSSILLDAINKIHKIANSYVSNDCAIRIAQIAREAAAKVNNTTLSKGEGRSND